MSKRAAYWLSVAGGVTLGLVLALPLGLPADSSCPAAGEGKVWCQFQGGLLQPLTLLVGGLVVGHIVGVVLTGGLPSLVGRLRAGERLRMRRGPIRVATDDPLLLAASWANVVDHASDRDRRRAQVTWLQAAGRPAATARAVAEPSAPSAGALPLAAVAVPATAPRPQRAVCPSCLEWHPLDDVADGCPVCGTACVVPPRIAQPSAMPGQRNRIAAR